MTDVLTVSNACKAFGATRALDGATLELREQEWLALLGPNGAGKTTLVRAIAGRVRLDSGELTLLGSDLSHGRAGSHKARERLGIIPQEIALYPQLTARENLTVFGSLLGLRGAALRDKVTWALEWTALHDRASEPIKRFSGGMKRRLNIACSVLHRPRVVLLDEPTVGVDPHSRARIWQMLEQLRSDGASLLFTTHQLDEAQQICDRIIIIDRGQVIAAGTFDELVRETVGTGRQVSVSLRDQVPATLQTDAIADVATNALAYQVEDIATELPAVLARIAEAGGEVVDVAIDAPTLQTVFIHLTGRELRE
ncbi:MAG: ABC transporter ATP-binding protein [Proteobacteria bacterium]|nr:ABC transporter ATP-binding protein [Pseudomonadota bacterium]